MQFSKSTIKIEGIFFLILGLLMTLWMSCKDSNQDTTTEAVDTKQINSFAFKEPSGEIKTVQIAWEKNKTPVISDTSFTSMSTALINIRTKSGYEFSTTLRKVEPVPPFEYELPDSLIAISDIEGNFDVFTKILLGLGTVDKDLNWSYGKNHLVLVGDFFDRGQEVFNCLWLIYKLELEAAKAGGKVHFIMGNHEQLNLMGDYRDMHEKYKKISKLIKVPYKEWLSKRSVIGEWLRNKNCMEKIGDNLFVHGGLHPDIGKKGLSGEKVNHLFRTAMNDSSKDLEAESQLVTGMNGPLWYRGMSLLKLRQGQVDTIVSTFDAKRVVVGHTVVDDEKISMLYDGRVINIDLYHAANLKKGILRVLLITKDGYFEIDDQLNKHLLN